MAKRNKLPILERKTCMARAFWVLTVKIEMFNNEAISSFFFPSRCNSNISLQRLGKDLLFQTGDDTFLPR